MHRRIMLKAVATVTVLGIGCTAKAKEKMKKWDKSQTDAAGIIFSHGVDSASMPDGSWNLWVRAASPNDAPEVKILLQVATDQDFSQIVKQQRFVSRYDNSYIVRTNYKPDQNSSLLYFRFVSEAGIAANQGKIGKLPTALEGSKIGSLSPWKN